MDKGADSYRSYLDGDDNGIAEIVGEYKDGLILYLNSYVKNIHLAEELAEDTFFRLITKKPKFSGKSTFKTWLYAIGRNTAIDYIRHASTAAVVPIGDMEACLRDENELESSYIKEEDMLALHRAMSQLNGEYRAVLWLVYFEGFSSREAATVLKKSDRQMKNLMYRAKKTLKSILEREGFVYEEL